MRDRTTHTMFLIEVILGVLLAVLIAAGLASATSTGYKVGPYAGFGDGLTMIVVGSVMASVVVALELQRRNLENSSTFRAEIREQIEKLHDGQAAIHRRLDAIARVNTETQDKLADELGHQRRDRDRT